MSFHNPTSDEQAVLTQVFAALKRRFGKKHGSYALDDDTDRGGAVVSVWVRHNKTRAVVFSESGPTRREALVALRDQIATDIAARWHKGEAA